MCTANIVTVVYLKKSKRKANVISNSGSNRENRFIVISVSLNILFFITHLPDSILQLWNQYKYSTGIISTVPQYYYVQIGVEYPYIVAYWKYLYSMGQVFIHLATNSIYRSEIKKIVCLVEDEVSLKSPIITKL